jgi:hypothetical protein
MTYSRTRRHGRPTVALCCGCVVNRSSYMPTSARSLTFPAVASQGFGTEIDNGVLAAEVVRQVIVSRPVVDPLPVIERYRNR